MQTGQRSPVEPVLRTSDPGDRSGALLQGASGRRRRCHGASGSIAATRGPVAAGAAGRGRLSALPEGLRHEVANLSIHREPCLLDAQAFAAKHLVGELDGIDRRILGKLLLICRRQAEAKIDAQSIEEDLDLFLTRGSRATLTLLTPDPLGRTSASRSTPASGARSCESAKKCAETSVLIAGTRRTRGSFASIASRAEVA